MISKILLYFILFLVGINTYALKLDLNIIKTIGDNRKEYTFFEIGSAAISHEKFIYVTDLESHNIRKFSWDGKMMKKVGKEGVGPGTFRYPRKITFIKDKIFIFDSGNSCITSMDNNLKVLNVNKIGKILFKNVYFLNNSLHLGHKLHFFKKKENSHLMYVFDKSKKIITSFFYNKEVEKYSKLDYREFIKISRFFDVKVGLSYDKSNILVTQRHPKNPAEFFLYNTKGELLKKFTYKYKNDYKFPDIDDPYSKQGYPYMYSVGSAFIVGEYIFIYVVPLKKDRSTKIKDERHFLVFNRDGEFLLRKDVSAKFGYMFFQITDDMHLIGAGYDNGKEKIVISKIRLSD